MSTKKNTAGRAAKRHKELNVNRIIQHDCENCKSISEKVQFAGQELIVATHDNQHFVAMRPIVEALGLGWSRQSRKLQQDTKFNCVLMSTVAEDGKQRDMLFVPLHKLNGWLFSINAAKCRPAIQEKIKFYQDQCFTALYEYFHNGAAVNPQATAPQLESLFNQVKEMQFELGYQKHRLELFDAIVECGTISKSTGNPRIVPVRGTYRSLPRRKDKNQKHSKIKQLTFLQTLFGGRK